jgi:isochorismate hydrolase
MVNQLIPEAADYIVLKPKHFAFYATPLDTLFSYLKVKQ